MSSTNNTNDNLMKRSLEETENKTSSTSNSNESNNNNNNSKLKKENNNNNNNESLKLSKSIFQFEPLECNLKVVSDFIFKHLNTPNLEIEAKFGIIIDKETKQRIRLPTMSEIVLAEDFTNRIRFESNMTEFQHRHFNNLLNFQFGQSRSEHYKGSPITCEHLKQTDKFYKTNNGERLRVSIDQKTNQIIPNGIIIKSRIADLNIHSPNTKLDFRISLNIETPVVEKPNGIVQNVRHKDRLSYTHELVKIDLTQVKPEFGNKPPTKDSTMHELELEFVNTEELKKQRELVEKNKNNQYIQIIQSFLNNIRLLSQKSI